MTNPNESVHLDWSQIESAIAAALGNRIIRDLDHSVIKCLRELGSATTSNQDSDIQSDRSAAT
jgi:hypothetical protein